MCNSVKQHPQRSQWGDVRFVVKKPDPGSHDRMRMMSDEYSAVVPLGACNLTSA